MLLSQFENENLLCNVSVLGPLSGGTYQAFRGDLVVVEGEIADAQGRRGPPKAVVRQAVLLSDELNLKMVSGAVTLLEHVSAFAAKYGSYLAADAQLLFYVSNISCAMQLELEGHSYALIPHDDGAVWSLLMDDLRLEKDDFKGQSAEDKVLTMFNELKSFSLKKAETVDLSSAQRNLREVVQEARGPV